MGGDENVKVTILKATNGVLGLRWRVGLALDQVDGAGGDAVVPGAAEGVGGEGEGEVEGTGGGACGEVAGEVGAVDEGVAEGE